MDQLITKDALQALQYKKVEMAVTDVETSDEHKVAVKSTRDGDRISVCSKLKVNLTEVHIDIRHRRVLVLRNPTWMAPNESGDEAILIRNSLRTLGFNTSELF